MKKRADGTDSDSVSVYHSSVMATNIMKLVTCLTWSELLKQENLEGDSADENTD